MRIPVIRLAQFAGLSGNRGRLGLAAALLFLLVPSILAAPFTSVAEDFTLTPNAQTQTITAGSAGGFTISVTSSDAGSTPGSPISLSVSVSPAGAGVAATITPASVGVGDNAALNVSVVATAAIGDYTITVTGSNGSVTHMVSTVVTVIAVSQPAFSISFSQDSFTGKHPGNVTIPVTITRQDGFTGKITVWAPVTLPTGVLVKGKSGKATKDTSVSLKFKIKDSAEPGTYDMLFYATDGGGRTVTANTTLVIQ